MSKVLHHNDNNNSDNDDAKAIAIPQVFSENSQAKSIDPCQSRPSTCRRIKTFLHIH